MTRPDLRALADVFLQTLPPIDFAYGHTHSGVANVERLDLFARTVAAAEKARIVASIRTKAGAILAACNLGSHATRAAALSKMADELEADQ